MTKTVKHNIATAILILTGILTVNYANANQPVSTNQNNEVNESAMRTCSEALKEKPESKAKEQEMKDCVFSVSQEIEEYKINNNLKTTGTASFDNIKTFNLLNQTVKSLRKTLVEPEGKQVEYERVSILFKDKAISLNDKKKEEKDFYKKFGKNNYKINEDTYKKFVILNNSLDNQYMKVKASEDLLKNQQLDLIKKIPGDSKEKQNIVNNINENFSQRQKSFEKEYKKEMGINKLILSSYNSTLEARKMEAGDYLNTVLSGKKLTLTKENCKLLDGMYVGYGLLDFKNLVCK